MAEAKNSSGAVGGHSERTSEAQTETGTAQQRSTEQGMEAPEMQRGIHTACGDCEKLQEVASDIAPQIFTVAIAAIATAVVSAEFLPAVLVGAAAVLSPKLLRGAGYAFRPLMKTVIRAGYATFTAAQQLVAEAGEQVQDVIAEVQAEQRTRPDLRQHEASPGS